MESFLTTSIVEPSVRMAISTKEMDAHNVGIDVSNATQSTTAHSVNKDTSQALVSAFKLAQMDRSG
jgi:hypothetical protein